MNKESYDAMYRRRAMRREREVIPTFRYQNRAEGQRANHPNSLPRLEKVDARHERRKAAMRLRLRRGRGRV